MSYLCPSCGRVYEERPASGGCLDCDGVAVVEALRSANKQGTRAGVRAFERAKRVRNAFVLVGMVLGGVIGGLWRLGKTDLLSPFVMALLVAGVVWGIGTVVWDRSHGLWKLRSRKSRGWVVTLLSCSMAGICLWGVLHSSILGDWQKESGKNARRSWTLEVRSQAKTLATCFDDGQTLDTPLDIDIRWTENDTITATPENVAECVVERATSWGSSPPLGKYRCVICPFEVQRADDGVRVFGPIPDDLTQSCAWTTSQSQCE